MPSTPKVIEPIPVIVISGFLGSGKTTLLNQLLHHLPRSALIINEFGSTPIDQVLIRTQGIAVSTLTGGCLCCQVRDALAPVLRNLRMAWEAKAEKPFDRVIIETSGVANPAPILDMLLTQSWLSKRYQLQQMITTVSALADSSLFERFPETTAQLAFADTIVFTHTDVRQDFAVLKERVQQLAPTALKVQAVQGAISPSLLLTEKQPLNYAGLSLVVPAHCFYSLSLQLTQVIAWQRLTVVLTEIMARYPKLVRLKGVVKTIEHELPVVIHGANGMLYPPAYLPESTSADGIGRLVLITDGKIERLAEELMQLLRC